MSKKIVLITGSPRAGGNTDILADAFVCGAESHGHTVKRFNAATMNVHGCKACETCYSKGTACSFEDDFNVIAPEMLEADAIVFAAPTYWYTFPAQIKCVLDKMFSFVIGGKSVKGKECALISCCEESDVHVMDGLVGPLERAAALMEWKVVGTVLVPGVYKKGDVEKTDGAKLAEELAAKF